MKSWRSGRLFDFGTGSVTERLNPLESFLQWYKYGALKLYEIVLPYLDKDPERPLYTITDTRTTISFMIILHVPYRTI